VRRGRLEEGEEKKEDEVNRKVEKIFKT